MEKIAVIDDDQSIVDVFSQTLAFFGYDTCAFTDPAEALERLPREDPMPDVILLDLMMSPMTGFQFLEELKKCAPLNGIPVIIVSAWDLAEENLEYFKEIIADVIKKPVHPRELEERIRSVLDKEKNQGSDRKHGRK